MSPDVAEFLRDMLLRQQIAVSDPNLVPIATLAARALGELGAVMAKGQPTAGGS
ncbi:hypothetical protein OHA01_26355 [Micromonospora zamorensis]|uniref:hypothetical protein n=1 Tax=Micromonospora zamorensis TaxID=709883 RepID=UPI003864BC60|nr:hypothetical protein OHA01_26355 [Micromonospora zamorensis]